MNVCCFKTNDTNYELILLASDFYPQLHYFNLENLIMTRSWENLIKIYCQSMLIFLTIDIKAYHSIWGGSSLKLNPVHQETITETLRSMTSVLFSNGWFITVSDCW